MLYSGKINHVCSGNVYTPAGFPLWHFTALAKDANEPTYESRQNIKGASAWILKLRQQYKCSIL
jgi:hypothetical protein